jgi:lipoate-protein ligase A
MAYNLPELSSNMRYLIDNRNNSEPSINLALEEYALRHLDISDDYLLLYQNNPSVVLGRHQNIWEEVNLNFIKKNGISIFRRISGGGTVYHDPGNLNYSFITKFDKFKFNNYKIFTEPIIAALQSLEIKAKLNSRNDIVIGDKKISGSAQFTSKDRMVSHGTLLYKSHLINLKNSLKAERKNILSKAIKSVKSSVVNISDFLSKNYDIEIFKEKLLDHIFNSPQHNKIELSPTDWQHIQQLAEDKYQKWDWIFGESPKFVFNNTKRLPEGEITIDAKIEKGKISSLHLSGDLLETGQFRAIEKRMSGTMEKKLEWY